LPLPEVPEDTRLVRLVLHALDAVAVVRIKADRLEQRESVEGIPDMLVDLRDELVLFSRISGDDQLVHQLVGFRLREAVEVGTGVGLEDLRNAGDTHAR